MSNPELFTGDDWIVRVTLTKDKQPYDASAATNIQAAIVSESGPTATVLVPAQVQSDSADGADWANGIIVCEFPAAVTNIEQYGVRWIEVQVTNGGKKVTWPRQPVDINQGLIA